MCAAVSGSVAGKREGGSLGEREGSPRSEYEGVSLSLSFTLSFFHSLSLSLGLGLGPVGETNNNNNNNNNHNNDDEDGAAEGQAMVWVLMIDWSVGRSVSQPIRQFGTVGSIRKWSATSPSRRLAGCRRRREDDPDGKVGWMMCTSQRSGDADGDGDGIGEVMKMMATIGYSNWTVGGRV